MKKNSILLPTLLIALAFTHFGFARHRKKIDVMPVTPPADQVCPPPSLELSQPQATTNLKTAIAAIERAQPIQCEDLQAGQSRLVVAKDDESPTSVHHMYKLTRNSDNDYEIVLNLKYHGAGGTDDSSIDESFRQKVTRCYQAADKALLGPNGEHMHIRLATPDEQSPVPPVHEISVTDGKFRGDADDYNASTFDCATILHESLHLMGLVDEYKEAKIGLVLNPNDPSGKSWSHDTPLTAWDCRAIGADDSVMSNMEAAWSKSFGQMRMAFFQLDCKCNSPKCKKAFLHPDPNARDCPNGAQDSAHQIFLEDAEKVTPGLNIIDQNHFVISRDVRTFTGSSLLKPAHFNSIVHPGCSENLPYYQCAENAYKTSKERNGDGCQPMPSYCHDGTTKWTDGTIGTSP